MVTEQEQTGLWDEVIDDDETLERAIREYAENKPGRSETRDLKKKRDDAISEAGLLNRPVGTTIRIGRWQLKIGESEETEINFMRGGRKAVREVKPVSE